MLNIIIAAGYALALVSCGALVGFAVAAGV